LCQSGQSDTLTKMTPGEGPNYPHGTPGTAAA
jgi:hypothetical protein